MTISESQRFELHLGLQKVLGDDMANTLMEHLPPSGWSDVARRSDIDQLGRDIGSLSSQVKFVIGTGIAFGMALLAIQVQILLSIANL